MSSLRNSILYGVNEASTEDQLQAVLNFSEIVIKLKNSSKPEKPLPQLDYLRNIDNFSRRLRIIKKNFSNKSLKSHCKTQRIVDLEKFNISIFQFLRSYNLHLNCYCCGTDSQCIHKCSPQQQSV